MNLLQSSAAPSAALRSFEAQWRSRPADSLSALRDEAMQRFLALGLPSLRDETWRYTDLRSLAAQSFVDAPHRTATDAQTHGSLIGQGEPVTMLVMINGHPLLPLENGNPNNLEINTIQRQSKLDSSISKRFVQSRSDADQQRWTLLNTALFTDGLYLKVSGTVETPVLILHVASGDSAADVAYPRVIIDADAGSSATIIEHHVTQGEYTPLSNSTTQVALKPNAQLEHYRVFSTGADATHLDSMQIHQERDSRCRQFTVALGGSLVRTSLEARLSQPGASIESYSLLVGHGDRHVDNVNIVTHGAAETRSRQTARAIAGDKSRVVFNSKVIVEAGAVHADSQQSCRGLLLSPSAEIDTRPQLEIRADEVKCAHGATIGRLDPDMLFYLLSRGIDRDTAQSLLVYAFLADVLTGMSVTSARAAIENTLITQLPDSQVLRKFR